MRNGRLLIGSRWGSLVGGPLRYGGRQYRLVVYPPGSDDRDRWLLRALQWWPGGGPVFAVLAFALLGPAGAPVSLCLAVALFLGPFLGLRHLVRRQRRNLAVVHADYLVEPGTAADLARCRLVVTLSSTLTDAERALERGELTPVDFQRIWGDVHAAAIRLRD